MNLFEMCRISGNVIVCCLRSFDIFLFWLRIWPQWYSCATQCLCSRLCCRFSRGRTHCRSLIEILSSFRTHHVRTIQCFHGNPFLRDSSWTNPSERGQLVQLHCYLITDGTHHQLEWHGGKCPNVCRSRPCKTPYHDICIRSCFWGLLLVFCGSVGRDPFGEDLWVWCKIREPLSGFSQGGCGVVERASLDDGSAIWDMLLVLYTII